MVGKRETAGKVGWRCSRWGFGDPSELLWFLVAGQQMGIGLILVCLPHVRGEMCDLNRGVGRSW